MITTIGLAGLVAAVSPPAASADPPSDYSAVTILPTAPFDAAHSNIPRTWAVNSFGFTGGRIWRTDDGSIEPRVVVFDPFTGPRDVIPPAEYSDFCPTFCDVNSISDSGKVLVHDQQGTIPFIEDHGTITPIRNGWPYPIQTFHMNNQGWVVGWDNRPTSSHALLYTPTHGWLDVHDALGLPANAYSSVRAINNSGAMLVVYQTPSMPSSASLLVKSTDGTSVNIAQQLGTERSYAALNDLGELVSFDGTRSFLSGRSFQVPAADHTYAQSVNNAGQVAGFSWDEASCPGPFGGPCNRQPFVWDEVNGVRLLDTGGNDFIMADLINGVGQVYARDENTPLPVIWNPDGFVNSATGSLTTDPGASGATAAKPMQVSVASPNGGPLSATVEDPTRYLPYAGYRYLDQQVVVAAQPATNANPLTLTFEIDSSIRPNGTPLLLFRDGSVVGDCKDATAVPIGLTACITSVEQSPLDATDLRVEVITVEASTWAFATTATSEVSVGNASVVEGDTGSRTISFPVTLSHAATTPVSVGYTVNQSDATGGTRAGSGADFKVGSGTVVFNPSASSGETALEKFVSVQVFGDTADESNETFQVVLSNVTGGGFDVGQAVGTGTIIDDDPGGGLAVGVGDASIVEGNAGLRKVKVPITVSAAPGAGTVTVPYTITDGSATWAKTANRGEDYGAATSGTLTFTGTSVSKTITITIYGDTTTEPDETFTVNLGAVTGATTTRPTGTITINNDDPGFLITPSAPAVSVGDLSVLEGDARTRSLVFPVSLSVAATAPVSVDYTVTAVDAQGGTRPDPDVDFKVGSGTVVFNPAAGSGETALEKFVSVQVFGDTADESNETFQVVLSNVAGAGFGLGQAVGTGTIIDDDPGGGLAVGVGDASIVEGRAGLRKVKVPVTLSDAPGAATVTVPYTITDGSATWAKTANRGEDYGAVTSGTLTFTGTSVSKTITITIYGDTTAELNETLTVNLGAVTGATTTRPTGTITIHNDD